MKVILCMVVYVYVGGMLMQVFAHVESIGLWQVSSLIPPYFFDTGSLTQPGAYPSSRGALSASPRGTICHYLSISAIIGCTCLTLFPWVQGSELRAMCLHGIHFFDIFLALKIILKQPCNTVPDLSSCTVALNGSISQ